MTLPALYKYLDFRGALLTLGNRTFKHAKPSDFNDTEDLTLQSVFPEQTEVALKKIEHSVTDVILQHLDDPPTCPSPMREGVALIQHLFRTDPEAANVVKAEMASEGAEPVFDVNHMRAMVEDVLTKINEHMQASRVLCVTTHRDSERMWVEYAENHKGIALRIEPNLAKDSKFKRFRPVIYREKRPSLYEDTDEFIAGALFGDLETRLRAMVEKIVYTKTLKWAHESEYRLEIPLRKNETPWNTDPYHPEEITELYLGFAMEKADAERIVDMALAVNPHIEIFRVKRWPDGSLGFDHPNSKH
jgi:hypothetical protein